LCRKRLTLQALFKELSVKFRKDSYAAAAATAAATTTTTTTSI